MFVVHRPQGYKQLAFCNASVAIQSSGCPQCIDWAGLGFFSSSLIALIAATSIKSFFIQTHNFLSPSLALMPARLYVPTPKSGPTWRICHFPNGTYCPKSCWYPLHSLYSSAAGRSAGFKALQKINPSWSQSKDQEEAEASSYIF